MDYYCLGGNLDCVFDVVVVRDGSGFIVFVPLLPGCFSQGDSLEEALCNVREAIELYLESLSEEEKRELLSREVVGLHKVRVGTS